MLVVSPVLVGKTGMMEIASKMLHRKTVEPEYCI